MSKNAVFFPRANLYADDYDCLFRNQDTEPYATLSYHDFYEFQIFLGPAGLMKINGNEYLVQRGDLAFIDMFTPHELLINHEGSYERFSISLDPSLLISMSSPRSNLLELFHAGNTPHPVVHLDDEVFLKYTEILDKYRVTRLKHGQDILDKSYIHLLLAHAYDDCYSENRMDDRNSHYVEIISQLISYINAHLSEELSLQTLADVVNYSEYYVCRIFKKMTGINLSSYIQEKRIGEAARLLRENMAVSKAAEAVGFNNYSYFYKTFLKLKGQSPADYKKTLSSNSSSGKL